MLSLQRCNTQFDSFQEKKNHACNPPKKVRIVENKRAEPVQCPGVELRTEPSPAQPQPIEVEKTPHNSLRSQCGKCEKKIKRKSHLDRHEQTCCRCQRCNTQFDLFQEKKNHACNPPKKVRIVENECAKPVQCPGVELRTEPSPAQPQPIVIEKTPLNPLRNEAEQSPYPSPSPQLPTIPSGAPATATSTSAVKTSTWIVSNLSSTWIVIEKPAPGSLSRKPAVKTSTWIVIEKTFQIYNL